MTLLVYLFRSNCVLRSEDYLDQEFTALVDEVDRISRTTQYNGQTLIDGGATSFGGTGSGSSVLHIGANSVSGTDTLTIKIDGLSASALGITGGSSAVGVSTQAASLSAIGTIDAAIKSVNNMRSDVGAYVNRLEHAINNMDNQEYNTQDAESRIRDVDFALESTKFTKNQILTQSSTSMLSQANGQSNSVLGLIG